MFALLLDNVVTKLYENTFPVHPAMKWYEVDPKIVKENDILTDGVFSPPEVPEQLIIVRKDDEFRVAVKETLSAVLSFIDGKMSAADLAKVAENNKTILDTINE